MFTPPAEDRGADSGMMIIFEFAGGPLDGKSVTGIRGDQCEAERYYLLTHRGKIGQRFKIASEYAIDILADEGLQAETPHRFQRHIYEVVDRLEEHDEVLVRAKYVQPTDEAKRAAGS